MEQQQQTLWTRGFVAMLFFETFCQMSTNMVNPVVSNFAVAMGTTIAVAGFLAGLNAMTSLILRPFCGDLLQRLPRKATLIAASFIFMMAALVCAVFPSVASLGVCRVVMGVAFVLKSTTVIVVISTLVPAERLGAGVGYVGLTGIVTGAIGPTFGDLLGKMVGYNITFGVSAALFALAFIIALVLKVPPAQTADQAKPAEKRSITGFFAKQFYVPALKLMTLTICVSALLGCIISLLLLVGQERGIEGISLFFVVYAVFASVVRPFSANIYDKYGLGKVFYVEVLCCAVSFVLLAFSSNLIVTLIAGAFFAVGQGSLYPTFQAESVRIAEKGKEAVSTNTFYFGADAGMMLGPVIGGALMGAFNASAMFLFNLAVCVAMLIIFKVWKTE